VGRRPGGYQVGNFPILWAEWNGIYRDTMRDFWRGRARSPSSRGASPAPATSTSRTAAGPSRRSTSSPPTTGFTLSDLVSYNEKHNEANLEDNRDGTDDNRSWNCGVEGPDRRPASTSCASDSSATS
jgi:glycogen operon protein